MTVNTLEKNVAPRSLISRPDEGPYLQSEGNEHESEYYNEIPECRDLERMRGSENQTLSMYMQRP